MVNSNLKRILKSRSKLYKSSRKLAKAREERIWIQNNPNINIVTYPYHKLKKKIKGILKKKKK